MDDLAGKEGFAKVDSIVDAKGASFKKVNATTMRDAAAINANKIAGGLGIEYLDNFAQGSAVIGKELQVYRKFEEMLKTYGWQQKDSWNVELKPEHLKHYKENNNSPTLINLK